MGFAVQAEHGTTLVISKDAKGESVRLQKHGGIESFVPTAATIAGASAIDGAMMIDLDGTCHGVGLILDGEVGEKEDPARGARYNSVLRYLGKHDDCVVVVVSEDRMIDVLPR